MFAVDLTLSFFLWANMCNICWQNICWFCWKYNDENMLNTQYFNKKFATTLVFSHWLFMLSRFFMGWESSTRMILHGLHSPLTKFSFQMGNTRMWERFTNLAFKPPFKWLKSSQYSSFTYSSTLDKTKFSCCSNCTKNSKYILHSRKITQQKPSCLRYHLCICYIPVACTGLLQFRTL